MSITDDVQLNCRKVSMKSLKKFVVSNKLPNVISFLAFIKDKDSYSIIFIRLMFLVRQHFMVRAFGNCALGVLSR